MPCPYNKTLPGTMACGAQVAVTEYGKPADRQQGLSYKNAVCAGLGSVHTGPRARLPVIGYYEDYDMGKGDRSTYRHCVLC